MSRRRGWGLGFGGVQAGGWCALVGGAGTPQRRSSLCPSLPPDEVHVLDITVRSFFSASAIFLPDACLPRPRTRRFDRVSEFLLCREKENIIVAELNEKDQTGFLRQQPKLKVSFNNEC